MNNEKEKIFKMLENKEINAEEATKLLSALNSVANTANKQNNSSSPDLSNILNKVGNVASNLIKKGAVFIKDISNQKNTNNNSWITKEFNYNLSCFNNNIKLNSLNGEAILKGYNGDKLTLRLMYKLKNPNGKINFYNIGNDTFSLEYESNSFEKVSFEVLLPMKYFKNIEMSNINSNYSIDRINFDKITLESRNSNGILENIEGKDLKLDNLNGNLIFKNILCQNTNINNINGYLKIKNIDSKELEIDSINANVEILNDYLNKYENYNWTIETQNSPIKVEINTDTVNYNIKASTTLGNIDINKPNIIFEERNSSKVVAYNENKNHNYKNMNIYMSTTNSTILLC